MCICDCGSLRAELVRDRTGGSLTCLSCLLGRHGQAADLRNFACMVAHVCAHTPLLSFLLPGHILQERVAWDPSTEGLSWDLGDLEDHFIQPTRITGGQAEKGYSYQRIDGHGPKNRQPHLPSPDSCSKWRCSWKKSLPASASLS